jgi:hypothetical protein
VRNRILVLGRYNRYTWIAKTEPEIDGSDINILDSDSEYEL